MAKSSARRHPPTRGTVEERFWRYVDKTDECWNWTGYVTPSGYGRLSIRRDTDRLAHRVSLAIHQGLELEGWKPGDPVVDHMCRNTLCVNPAHLRLVSQRTNTIENSIGVAARNIVKTVCVHGHPIDRVKVYRGKVSRFCLTCASHHQAASRRKRRERAAA